MAHDIGTSWQEKESHLAEPASSQADVTSEGNAGLPTTVDVLVIGGLNRSGV
jgi:hypothetical protein